MSPTPGQRTPAARVYGQLRTVARAAQRSTNSYLVLYATERFLERLTRSRYREDFILKGGVLLAAYQVRRPTKDADMQVVDQSLDEEFVRSMVTEVAGMRAGVSVPGAASDGALDDGVSFDVAALQATLIRDGEDDQYAGFRVKFDATVHSARSRLQLDISTGDPVHPTPQVVRIPSVLPGMDVQILGYPLEAVVAEKTVTMLQRGAANTRWRDFLDVRALASQHRFEAATLGRAVQAVARYRQVDLAPLTPLVGEFDNQRRWSEWLRNLEMDPTVRTLWCEPVLVDQVRIVAAFIDPVLTGQVGAQTRWDPTSWTW